MFSFEEFDLTNLMVRFGNSRMPLRSSDRNLVLPLP